MKILRFTAAWCAPCKVLASNLEIANIDLPIEVIDADVHQELCLEFGIKGVPTLVLMNDEDKEISRKVGLMTSQQIKEWLDSKT